MRLFPVAVQFRLEVKMESYFCRDEFRDSEFVVWFFFVAQRNEWRSACAMMTVHYSRASERAAGEQSWPNGTSK